MMQANEIRQRFSQVEQTIHHVADLCQSAITVPMDLKDCIQQLDQRSIQVRQVIQQSMDEDRIRQYVDDLEQLGDRTRDACQQSGSVNDELKTAVMQAHRELSDLKRQMH